MSQESTKHLKKNCIRFQFFFIEFLFHRFRLWRKKLIYLNIIRICKLINFENRQNIAKTQRRESSRGRKKCKCHRCRRKSDVNANHEQTTLFRPILDFELLLQFTILLPLPTVKRYNNIWLALVFPPYTYIKPLCQCVYSV